MSRIYLANAPGFPAGGEAIGLQEQIEQLCDALASLIENLNYLFSHLSEENFTQTAIAEMREKTQAPLVEKIEALAARVAALEGGETNASLSS